MGGGLAKGVSVQAARSGITSEDLPVNHELGQAHKYKLIGLGYEHVFMDWAQKHIMLKGQAYARMLIGQARPGQ